MDTNSNIPPQKKVVSVEILHLDELGYGPQGKHTRREWRAECLENLLLGKSAFKSWQTNLVLDNGLPKKSFACKLILENGTTIPVLNDKYLDKQSSYALDYVGHVFEKSLHVSKYDFEHNALFNGARFNKFAYFAGCIFKLQALFSNSIFIRDSVFSRVEFNSYAAFRDIDFRKYANFRNTSFIEDADFSCSAFGDHVDFIRANFQSQCRFNKSQFQKLANFENAIFENIGHFEGANFQTRVPAFRGCKIDVTRLEFSENSNFPDNDFLNDAVENTSFLKRLSDEHGQTDQALRFNALELNIKYIRANIRVAKIFPLFRFKEADWWFAKTTYLYKILSNYGRSFIRPISWYFLLLVVSALCAMIYSTYSDSPAAEQQVLCKQQDALKLPYGRAVVEYALFRAGGLMDFTDTGKQNNAVNCRLFGEPIEPPLMRAWGIFKGIASIALLFLAALGLRNKYRIK